MTASSFPYAYDDSILYQAIDEGVCTTAQDWEPGDDSLVLEPGRSVEVIPQSGFITVYADGAESLPPRSRAITLSYSGRSGDVLTGVVPVSGDLVMKPLGSRAVCNVMAAHHEGVRSAVMALQRRVGSLKCPGDDTLESFARSLRWESDRPVPWLEVDPPSGGVGRPFQFQDLSSGEIESRRWDFGDGTSSSEVDPKHAYVSPGSYDVSLTVSGPSGEASIRVRSAVRVTAPPPLEASVTVDPPAAIAGETQVTLRCESRPSSGDPIVEHSWDLGPNFQLQAPNLPAWRFTAPTAGTYPVAVKRIAASGSYAWSKGESLDVFERGSLWCVVGDSVGSASVSIAELARSTQSWMTRTRSSWTRSTSVSVPAGTAEGRTESWATDGALLAEPSTLRAHHLYSSSKSEMRVDSVDVLSDTWRIVTSRFRGWGWRAAVTQAPGIPDDVMDSVFVFFGSSDPEADSAFEMASVERFTPSTESWAVDALPIVAKATVRDEGPGTPTPRWRVSGWDESFYLMRSPSPIQPFSLFLRYSPTTNSWQDLGRPMWSNLAIDVEQCELAGMSKALYMFAHREVSFGYATRKGLWFRVGFKPPWVDPTASSLADERVIVQATAGQKPGDVSSDLAYVQCPYSSSAIGVFDEAASVARRIASRPIGHLWASGSF